MNCELKRPREAAKILGIGLSTFWLWAKKDPEFPALVKLSPRCTAVRLGDLVQYIESKSTNKTICIKAMDSKDVMRSLRSGGALQRAIRDK